MIALCAVLAALGSSFTGRSMAAVSLAWLVVDRTGSGGATGLAAAATTLPLVLSALLGGGLVDRAGARRASITADLATALALAAIPAVDLLAGSAGAGSPVLGLAPILVLAALAATSEGPGGAAREALLPAVARHARVPLERANSWYKAVEASTALVGPLTAGLLIATVGARGALLAAATTFAAASLITTTLVSPAAAAAGADGGAAPRAGYPAFLAQGLRFLWGDRTMRAMVLIGAVLLACTGSFNLVALPVHLNRTGDAAGLGLVLGALGAGLVVGVLAYGAVGFRLPRRPLALACLYAVAAGQVALVTLPPLPVLVAIMAVNGLVAGPLNPLIATILQEHTPPELRGRVFGAAGALFVSAVPAGSLLVGFAIDAAGLRPTLAGLAAVFTLATTAAAVSPGLRDLSPPAPPTPVAAPVADAGGTR
jgi:MFS family permease